MQYAIILETLMQGIKNTGNALVKQTENLPGSKQSLYFENHGFCVVHLLSDLLFNYKHKQWSRGGGGKVF